MGKRASPERIKQGYLNILKAKLARAKKNRDHVARGKVRYSTPPGGSNTTRQAKAAAAGEVKRAQRGIDIIQANPGMSLQEIQQVTERGSRTGVSIFPSFNSTE